MFIGFGVGLFFLYRWHLRYAQRMQSNFHSFYQRPIVRVVLHYIYWALMILMAAGAIMAWAIFFTTLL